MKLSLREGRVASAPPRLTPFAARWVLVRAWVRESLSARLLGAALGLAVLNVVGSALAGATASSASAASDVSPAASSVPAIEALTAPADAGSAASEPAPAAAPTAIVETAPSSLPSADTPVDLNTATLDDLRRLPGVGPKRAEAILAVRARLGGRFRQVEDLLKVKGIGRATLKRLRPLVTLSSAH